MDVRTLKPIEGLRDPVPASGYNAILHAVQRLMETPPAAVMGRTGLPGFFRVDSSTQDGTNQRWVYTLVEVHKASTGYDGWADLPQGRQVTARNTAERDGVDAPVPNGTVVLAAPVMSGVNLEWWFTYVRPGSGSGSPVRWGRVIEGWSYGNSVRLAPCAGPLDDTPTGQSVDAYIVLPHGVSPRPLDLAEGAIVPFVTVGDYSVVLSVRVATLDLKNNGSTAIATTRQINIPAQTNGVLAFDGSDLKLGSGSDGQVLIWDNSQGKWVIDWVWLV